MKVCEKLSSTKTLTYALSFFQPVVAHAERIIKWTALMPSWIYSSSNEKSAISKLQMKNTNWSFQILMIFHEFSLLNSLWSRRHFILFSKFETKVEIWNFFQEFPKSWIFGKKFPDRSTARIPKKQIVVLMIRWFGLTDNIRFDLRIRLISWDSCETKFMNFLYQVVYAIFKYFFLDYSWKIRQRLFCLSGRNRTPRRYLYNFKNHKLSIFYKKYPFFN